MKKNIANSTLEILEYLKKIAKDGEVIVSNDQIAEEVFCAVGTVQDCLRTLESKGLIKREAIGRKRIIRLVEM